MHRSRVQVCPFPLAGHGGAQAVGRGEPEEVAWNFEAHHAQEARTDREGYCGANVNATCVPQTRPQALQPSYYSTLERCSVKHT